MFYEFLISSPYANLPYPAYPMMNNSATSNLPVASASSSTSNYNQSGTKIKKKNNNNIIFKVKGKKPSRF